MRFHVVTYVLIALVLQVSGCGGELNSSSDTTEIGTQTARAAEVDSRDMAVQLYADGPCAEDIVSRTSMLRFFIRESGKDWFRLLVSSSEVSQGTVWGFGSLGH